MRDPDATGSDSSRRAATSRVEWVDVLRGLLVLAVIFGHVTHLLAGHVGDMPVATRVSGLLQPVRIPALFLVSGALFGTSLGRPWLSVLRRRILPLCWVLVVWLVVESLVHATVGVLPSFRPDVLIPYVVRQLWLPEDYLWFIWALVLMSLLARVVVRRWLMLLIAAALLWSAPSGVTDLLALGKQTESFFRNAPLFLIGAAAAPWVRTPPRVFLAALPLAAGVYLTHVLSPAATAADSSARAQQVWLLAVALAGTVCMVVLAMGAARTPLQRPLASVGAKTLPLYLVHMPVVVLSVFGAVATWFLPEATAAPRLFAGVIFLAAAGTGSLLPRMLGRLGIGGVFWAPAWLLRSLDPAGRSAASVPEPVDGSPPGSGNPR